MLSWWSYKIPVAHRFSWNPYLKWSMPNQCLSSPHPQVLDGDAKDCIWSMTSSFQLKTYYNLDCSSLMCDHLWSDCTIAKFVWCPWEHSESVESSKWFSARFAAVTLLKLFRHFAVHFAAHKSLIASKRSPWWENIHAWAWRCWTHPNTYCALVSKGIN